MNLLYKDKLYDVPKTVKGQEILSLLKVEPSGDYYLRKASGDVQRFLKTIDYQIEEGDILQRLRDFVLG